MTWELPENPNGPLVGYRLYYKRSNRTSFPPGSDKFGYEVININSEIETQYNVTGLMPSTNYTIFVEAIGLYDLVGRVNLEMQVLTRNGKCILFYYS